MIGAARLSRRRRVTNTVAIAGMGVAVLVALVPLFLILAYVLYKGAAAISWDFLTQNPPFEDDATGGGYLIGIQGTLKLIVASSAMAVL